MNRTLATLLRLAALVAVWVALWGSPSPANLLSGLAVAVAVTVVFPVRAPEALSFRPLPAIRYAAIFTWLLVASTWGVVVEVLRPRLRLRQAIVEVELESSSAVVTTLVANTISLTPGTLTVEVREDPTRLYVHALRLGDPSTVRATVNRLERLASAACGTTMTGRP